MDESSHGIFTHEHYVRAKSVEVSPINISDQAITPAEKEIIAMTDSLTTYFDGSLGVATTLEPSERLPKSIERTTDIELWLKRNAPRIAPTDGYALVVDGHFKTVFAKKAAATKAATELLAKYPMLQVEIYDASSKSRSSVK
jgi:hypothetical protein